MKFAVIGSPIAHSKSPAMHQAAYRALGLAHTYDKLETSDAELEARVRLVRDGTYEGLNVTVPHKTQVLRYVDEVDASAVATGAANTLVRTTGGVRAHNTDAPALAEELVRVAGGESATFGGASAIVLGTGGAARAAIYALATLGVSHITVRGRKHKPELDHVLDVFRGAGRAIVLEHGSLAATAPGERRPKERADLRAIVQATTAGMDGSSVSGDVVCDGVDWESVHSACVVLDVVYAPPRTPILHRAAALGLRSDGGLGMLVRQGALAFELWLHVRPPLDVMRAAIGG